MKRNYYQVSVLKDTSGFSKEEILHLAERDALEIAKKRKRMVDTGEWKIKHIGQTPTRHVFRVCFIHACYE